MGWGLFPNKNLRIERVLGKRPINYQLSHMKSFFPQTVWILKWESLLFECNLNMCVYIYVNYKLALAMGACHLPLKGLSHELLRLLTLNTLWKESGWRTEIRHPVLGGKTGRTGLQIVSYFQEPILWAQILYFPVSRKALKSFMVTAVSRD